MATEAEIAAHERAIQSVIDEFNTELQARTQTLQDQIALLGTSATREQIQSAFQPIRDLAQQTRTQLDQILESNINLNSSVLGQEFTNELAQAVNLLKTQTIDRAIQQIEQEQNSVIETVVLAGIAGAVATDLVAQTRSLLQKAVARITTQVTTGVMQFDTVVTRLRSRQQGVKRYRYAGGIIDKTRPFCAELDGGVFTEEEIRDIWDSTWSGQAPGDPFVVRGGYNCRHFWVPVEDE